LEQDVQVFTLKALRLKMDIKTKVLSLLLLMSVFSCGSYVSGGSGGGGNNNNNNNNNQNNNNNSAARDYSAWVDEGIVYSPVAGDANYPNVLYDVSAFGTATTDKYYMWYSDDNLGLTYLVKSADGVSWGAPTLISLPSGGSDHTQALYDANCFGVVPCTTLTPKFKMWYWNGITSGLVYTINAMSVAESVDGLTWTNLLTLTQDVSAPIVSGIFGGFYGTYGPVSLFYKADAINTGADPWKYSYVMYYDITPDGSSEATGMGYSADGVHWFAASPSPVLAGSAAASWDCNSSVYGAVYKDVAGYHYWYSGAGANDGSGGCLGTPVGDGIGYAYSSDGITWTKSTTNPIFHMKQGVPYRRGRVDTPSVVDDGSGVLKMYYSASIYSNPPWDPGVIDNIGLAILH